MPSEHDDRAAASRFVAALGAAMASANYPVTLVRGTMEATSQAYGLNHQFLTLPNYIQVGSQSGEGLYIANPDFNLRYDHSFRLPSWWRGHRRERSSPERVWPRLNEFAIWTSDFRCRSLFWATRCRASGWR